MTLTVSITGLDAVQRLVDPSLFAQKLDRAVERAAEAIRDDTKRMPPVSGPRQGYSVKGIPVDTGRMRQSIQKRKLQLLAAEVIAPVKYSGYVHDGSSRVPARPFFQWVLEDFGGRERIGTIVADHLRSLF